MESYKLVFKRSVEKDLASIPKRDVKRIIATVDSLQTNPRPTGCDKLSGQEKYRVRQGNYRIVYEIRDSELVVKVIKVGNRRDVYRDL